MFLGLVAFSTNGSGSQWMLQPQIVFQCILHTGACNGLRPSTHRGYPLPNTCFLDFPPFPIFSILSFFSIPSFVLPRTPLKNQPALRYLFQSKTQSWSVDLNFKATGSQLWILKQGKRCDLIYISESSLSEVQRICYSRTGLEARTVGGCWVNLGRKWIFWKKKAYRKR